MRKRKKSEEGGFNVWRSYSDMMAGVREMMKKLLTM